MILKVSPSRLVLVNEHKTASVSIDYPSIILHSTVSSPQTEVYCQVDATVIEMDENRLALQDAFLELHLVISDDTVEVYEALCECANLHPGPDSDDLEEDTAIYYSEEAEK